MIEVGKEEKKKGYDDYECRDFAECLIRAEEIKKDPKKMAAAQKHIKKLKKDISSIADLKAVAKEKMESEEDYS